jgi:hypothetical protein
MICWRTVPSCPHVSSATVFAIAVITSSISMLSGSPAAAGYSAKKFSIVRRHDFLDTEQAELRDDLAHLI